jgi:hypothetical protein
MTQEKGGRTMPGISPFTSLKKDFYRFVGLLSWDPSEDQLAAEKLIHLIKTLPKGIDRETFQGYYLTGERTMVIIGQVDTKAVGGAAVAVQKLSSMVAFGTNIEASFYHAVEAHDLTGAVKETMKGPRASRKKG